MSSDMPEIPDTPADFLAQARMVDHLPDTWQVETHGDSDFATEPETIEVRLTRDSRSGRSLIQLTIADPVTGVVQGSARLTETQSRDLQLQMTRAQRVAAAFAAGKPTPDLTVHFDGLDSLKYAVARTTELIDIGLDHLHGGSGDGDIETVGEVLAAAKLALLNALGEHVDLTDHVARLTYSDGRHVKSTFNGERGVRHTYWHTPGGRDV